MKKKIILFFLILMLYESFFVGNNYYANELLDKNTLELISEKSTELFEGDFEKFYFIYSTDTDREWYNEKVICSNLCEEGYLYVKDMKTSVIKKILNVQVDSFEKVEEKIYLITSNKIFCYSIEKNTLSKVYDSSKEIKKGLLKYSNNCLYFIENNVIKEININTLISKEIIKIDNTNDFDLDGEYIYCHLSDDKIIKYNLKTKVREDVPNFDIENNTLDADILITRALSYNPIDTDSNLDLILNQYPAGSTYTKNYVINGSLYASDCYSFAMYCYDVFCHRMNISNASTIYGTLNNSDFYNVSGSNAISFLTSSDVEAFLFSKCNGSHIRYKTSSGAYHSIIYVHNSGSSNFKIYESNLNSDHKVTYADVSSTVLNSRMAYSYFYYKHNYGSPSYSDPICHVYNCLNSSCGGYVYEPHRSTDTGSIKYCDICGGLMGNAN